MIEAIRVESSADGQSMDEEQVGVLKLALKEARSLPFEIRVPLGLGEADIYLEMHLDDPVEKDNPLDILSIFHETFSQVASYIRLRDWQPSYIIGISHKALVLSTQLYGFKSLPVDPAGLTKKQLNRIQEGYQKTRSFLKGKAMGAIMACYLSYGELMARFGGQGEPQSTILG